MHGLAFLFTLGFVMTKKMDFSWLLHAQYVKQHDAVHGQHVKPDATSELRLFFNVRH